MSPAILALVSALQAPAVEVDWRENAHCSQDLFKESLARFLEGASDRRAVRVRIAPRRVGEGRWAARLVLETADGRSTRLLRGRSCAEISEAAAFVTAVVVDPGVLSRRPGETGGAGDSDMSLGTDGGAATEAPEGASAANSTQATREVAEAGGMGVPVPPPPAPSGGVPAAGSANAGGSAERAAEPSADLSLGTSRDARGERPVELGRAGGVVVEEGDPGGPEAIELAARGQVQSAAEPSRVHARAGAGMRGFARVAGGIEALGMPRIGPQVALAGGVFDARRRWRVELTGLYRAPTTVFTAIDPSAGARVRMWAVGARGCGVPGVGRSGFPLCGGFEVGQAIGEGVGFAGRRADRFAWVAVVLGPAFTWAPRRWLSLWVGADLGVPLLRGRFEVKGLGTVFEIAPVSLRAALGLEFRFGANSRGTSRIRQEPGNVAGPT